MVAEEIHSYRGFTKTRTELKYALFSLKCYQRHSHVTTTFSCFSIHLPTSLVSEGAQLSFIVGGTSGKEPTYQSRRHKRQGFDPWIGKIPGEGNVNPLQYSCLENPRDRGAWRATAHGVTKCQTQLSTHTLRVVIINVQIT